jgi:hypothetical protein
MAAGNWPASRQQSIGIHFSGKATNQALTLVTTTPFLQFCKCLMNKGDRKMTVLT